MRKPAGHIPTLKQTAQRLGLQAKQIHAPGETLLGRTIHVSNGKQFCIISSKRIGFYPEMPTWFKMVCNSKYTANLLLERLQYQTIPSIYFNITKCSDPEYRKKQMATIEQYPVICKPEEGLKGNGIMVIYGVQQLKKALATFREQQKSFLVQPIVRGVEYRVLVVNNRVFVAHTKSMPGIIGDGKRTIEQLLSAHTDVAQDQAFINSELRNRALTADDILPRNEMFPTHITRKGGPEIYVKDQVPTPIGRWARKLCQDLSTKTLGVDVFIPSDFSNTEQYQIIEINANPGFTYLASRYKQNELVKEIAESILKSYFRIKN